MLNEKAEEVSGQPRLFVLIRTVNVGYGYFNIRGWVLALQHPFGVIGHKQAGMFLLEDLQEAPTIWFNL